MKKTAIKFMCLSAVMSAAYVGLDLLAQPMSALFGGYLKISLSGLPIIIVSIFCGPLWAAATGFIGALVGQMLSYGFTATTLLWVLPAVMRGITMGVLFAAFKKSTKPWILGLEIWISAIVVTLFNTLAMLVEQKLYGYYSSYVAIFGAVPSRIFTGTVTALVLTLIVPVVIYALEKSKLFRIQRF